MKKIKSTRLKKKNISSSNFLKILLIVLFPLSTFLLGMLYGRYGQIVSNNNAGEEFEISENVNNGNLTSLQKKVIKLLYTIM